MRKPLILFTTFSILFICSTNRAYTQTTLIPDPNFEQELINMGWDTAPINGSVPTANISGVTTLFVSFMNIHDLTGIQGFTSLQILYCSSNSLTSLDLSANTALQVLICNNNSLTSLDLSANTALQTVLCDHNQLTSLNVTHCPALGNVDCQYNQITSLDVTHNTALTALACNNNKLTVLDVTKNLGLQTLYCFTNLLPALDVTKNSALIDLGCRGNKISFLDLTKNTALTNLDCAANLLPNLDVTKNTALTIFYCDGNLLPALDVTKNVALMTMSCVGNKLAVLDVTKNTILTDLICGSNLLSALDVSKNTVLTNLNCSNNPLFTLDLTKNATLASLQCVADHLSVLDLTKNTALVSLGCNLNQLTALDLTKNTSLKFLDCQRNLLTSLNLKNGFNPLILQMYSTFNPNLACIQVDNAVLAAGYYNWHKDATAQYDEYCAPTILSFTPASGCSGQVVNITGTNLNVATAVSFGGVPASSFSILSATKIAAVVGAGASGNINIITPNGTATFPGFIFYSSPPIAAVNINSTNSTICSGTNVTFTATSINGGPTPTYQWQLNGSPVGTNTASYSTTSLTNGDVVKLVMTSGLGCVTNSPATSNSIVMIVSPIVTPSISIVADQTTICPGTNVNFTATAINGSTNPVYQWKLNGSSAGTNSPVFVTNALNNGDLVKCIITNNDPCVTVASATSNVIQETVNSNTAPSVSILASVNDVCPATPVTFTATALNAGATSSYQWKLNGINVGTNSPIYVNNNFTNGDKVNCVLNTATNCLGATLAQSATVMMIVKPKSVISFDPSAPKINFGNFVQLNATVSGSPLRYLWTPAMGLSNATVSNPRANPAATTTYNLNVVAANGCVADKALTIKVANNVFMPNSFLPAGNATNSIFRIPPGTSLTLQYFIIYDRYGNEIFQTADVNKGWDGTNRGTRSPQGTYVYLIKGFDYSGEVLLQGSVLLIR